jgi:ankyrin repeat protein
MNVSTTSSAGAAVDLDRVISAARAGDLATVDRWLAGGGNPDQYDREGWTPLLAAAVRGQAKVVSLLLDNPHRGADPALPHPYAGACPIHFAGHSGSVETARLILDLRPDQLEQVWLLNGHTLLLQAVFYGHRDLAAFALERGADTAATTIRGLAGVELARQFEFHEMAALLGPHDSPPEAKQASYQMLLDRIAPYTPWAQRAPQQHSDRLVQLIEDHLGKASDDSYDIDGALAEIRGHVESTGLDVNRLGGQLRQPPLTVAVTGTNGNPPSAPRAELRRRIARYLLERGADPGVREHHPMAVDAVIRAAVFNYLDILKLMAEHMTPQSLAAALRTRPLVNGLTALHDSALRATMAGPDRLPGYLEQIRWCVAHGAGPDIEDYSGRTPRSLADGARDPGIRREILDALQP